VTGGCLGDVAAALVDGELDHAGRERAHRHLAHCARCRAEVDAQRRLKARLSGSAPPDLPSALTDRLLRLTSPLEEAAPRVVRPPSRPATAPAGLTRPVGGRPGSPRPPGPRPGSAVRRRASTGSAVVLLGVAAALALGAPPRQATTPVDPATDAFVAEFVSTTADGSSTAAVPVPAARTAGLTTFVPLTRTALLSTGGARTTR
jgi:anti-sigma factor RsiW